MSKIKRHLQVVGVNPQEQPDKFWEVRAAADDARVGELLIYGPIFSEKIFEDEVSPKAIKDELDALGDIDRLDVFINSPGGSVFAGVAIHSILSRVDPEVVVHVDGLAASAASIIAMAGDKIVMASGSMLMVHNAWTIVIGDAKEMRKTADLLDQIQKSMVAIYKAKTGLRKNQIVKLLDDETWMTAEEAVAQGFADEVEESKQVAACLRGDRLVVNGQEFDISQYQRRPDVPEVEEEPEEEEPKAYVPEGFVVDPAAFKTMVQEAVAEALEQHQQEPAEPTEPEPNPDDQGGDPEGREPERPTVEGGSLSLMRRRLELAEQEVV